MGVPIAVLAIAAPSGGANPGAHDSASCGALARGLIKQTKVYRDTPADFHRYVQPWDAICHDFTGDGRKDVAFGILSGGTGGAFRFAVFRRTAQRGGGLAGRYVKMTERGHGSKTSLQRSGRRLKVINPVYRPSDGNCCPSGGVTVRTYRFTEAEIIYVGKHRVGPR